MKNAKRKIILQAADLDGYLNTQDKKNIQKVESQFALAQKRFKRFENQRGNSINKKELIKIFNRLGSQLQQMIQSEPRIHVFSLETPEFIHGEASRLIAKLRDRQTPNPEFVYYTQRAYEMLFNLAMAQAAPKKRHYIFVKTPVSIPTPNFAIHRIPNIDHLTSNSVMGVMLRAALLPSLIVSKEIQEYSTTRYVTPFALFKISRDDRKQEHNMAYTLDLDRSYFDLKTLDNKDFFFADPMNATGGSLITIVKYLQSQGVRFRSIKFFNVVSTIKAALRIIRALPQAEVFTLWMDPALNSKAYILPGLGDAGDRINGTDLPERPRNIIQLVADYGSQVTTLYRDQIHKIEEIVLGK